MKRNANNKKRAQARKPKTRHLKPPVVEKPPVEEIKVDTESAGKPEVKEPSKERERSSYSTDADSGIKIYLREIGQTKLLTVQEEIKLAARIKKGDQDARTHMIKANLRLVVKIAHDYSNLGLPLLDLISEGNIGLMKA